MPEQPKISPGTGQIALPLELLLSALVAEGFPRDRVGTPLLLRLMDLLNQFQDDTSEEQLKYKLSALICHSAEEQTKFYRVFDDFVARFRPQGEIDIPPPPPPKPAPPPIAPPPPPPPHSGHTPPVLPEIKTGSHSTDSVKAARSGPITVELNFRDDGYRPWNLPELESVVRPLREKELTGAEEWDIPKTIQQTIRAGGAPHFARRRRRSAPQYLFLIEQKSARDHLAGFYADLVSELSRRDLDAEFFFYDRIPQLCWKDRRDPASYTSIERLNASYAMSRLVLIGEPDGLLAVTNEKHPKTNKTKTIIHLYPSPLAFRLRDEWPAVALLNTRSTANWGEVETAMHQLFPIAPASVAGLGSLMEQWKNRFSFKPYYWKLESPEPIPPAFQYLDSRAETVLEYIKSLKFYLGRQGYTWLCAIAVYPEIYWQLTKILHDEAISKEDVPDESLRTQLWHLYLLRLSRLEWLRRGNIPPEYRRELRKGLPEANGAEVRRQLLEVLRLSENKPPADSYAEKDRAYTVALFDHERYTILEKPDETRLAAMQEKLWKDVKAEGVEASDIEDAVGRRLFQQLPVLPVESLKNYWVLWVDDTPANNISFQDSISKDSNIRFVCVTNTTKALETLQTQAFDMVVSDVSRHGDKESGIKMMRRFQQMGIQVPTYFFTHPNYVTRHRELLMGMGAVEVLTGFKQLREYFPKQVREKEELNSKRLFKIKFLEAMQQASKAICRVVLPNTVSTGFITKDGYLFTCNHVITTAADAELAKIQVFDFGGDAKISHSYTLDAADFISSPLGELDFTRVKIKDNPEVPLSRWGYVELETSLPPNLGDELHLVMQSDGQSKELQLESVKVLGQNSPYLYYEQGKMPGSSGAPVFNENMKVVAMHRAQGLEFEDQKRRQGVLISDILAFVEKNKPKGATNAAFLAQADALFDKGQEAIKKKDYEAAQSYLQSALEIFTAVQNNARRASTLHELGKVMMETGQLGEAKTFLLEALSLNQKLDFGSSTAFVLIDLGNISRRVGDQFEARSYYSDALEMLEGISADMEAECYEVLMALGAISEEMGELETAKKQTLDAKKRSRRPDSAMEEYQALMQLGRINMKLNDTFNAIGCFKDALILAEKMLGYSAEALVLENLAKAVHLSGDTKLALDHLDEAIRIYAKEVTDEAGEERVKQLRMEWLRVTQETPIQQQSAPPNIPEPALTSRFVPGTTKLFILLAELDAEEYNELTRHLSVLKRSNKVSLYGYNQVNAGEEWEPRLRFEMEQADYILVLITPNLLASERWYSMLQEALKLEKKVIPIRARICDLEGTGLEKLRSLPSEGRWIRDFKSTDEAYADVVAGIKRLLPESEKASPKEELKVTKDQVKTLIAEGNTRQALEALLVAIPEEKNTVYMLLGNYTKMEREQQMGMLSHEDNTLIRNQIANATIELLKSWPGEKGTESVGKRHSAADISSTKKNLQDLIAQGELRHALELLHEVLPDDNVVVLLGKLTALEKQQMLNVLSPTEISKVRTSITGDAFDLLEKLPDEPVTTQGADVAEKQAAVSANISIEMQLQIRDLIGQAKMREALNLLREASPNTRDVMVLLGEQAALESAEMKGILSRTDITQTKNRIAGETLKLLESLSVETSDVKSDGAEKNPTAATTIISGETKRQIKEYIGQGEIRLALELWRGVLPNEREVIVLLGRLSEAEQEANKGMISYNDLITTKARIASDTIDLLEKLPDETATTQDTDAAKKQTAIADNISIELQSQIRGLIARAELRQALDLLRGALPNTRRVTVLSGELAELESGEMKGIFSLSEIFQRKNRIANDTLKLLENLHDETSSAQGAGVEKNPATAATYITGETKSQIREYLQQGENRQALELLRIAMPNEREVIVLLGRLSEVEQGYNKGIISHSELSTTKARIARATLELLENLPDETGAAQNAGPEKNPTIAATFIPGETKNQIREFIEQGEIRQALELLRVTLPDESKVKVLQAQLSEVEKGQRLGILSDSEINVTRARISQTALDLTNSLPNDIKIPPKPQ